MDDRRVLAVRADPAEAAPNANVMLRALTVSAEGTLSTPTIEWALCVRRKDVAENNSVAPECLELDAEWIVPIARVLAAQPVVARVPSDACALFGSEPPPPPPGELPVRPADPDRTGGYYQPVRLQLTDADNVSFGHVRLRCALPSAPADVARDFAERYRSNENPTLREIAPSGGGRVRTGQPVELNVRWDASSLESYVVYDTRSRSLEGRKERLQLSWYTTGGSFDTERAWAVPGAISIDNTWYAPAQPGTAYIWAVLRDDRGGVDWGSITLEVR